jgi:16S rRNA processing protein RimM
VASFSPVSLLSSRPTSGRRLEQQPQPPLLGRTNESVAPIQEESSSSSKPQRRRRKNKYDTFSKVKQDKDPLEEMIEESSRKNQELVDEQQRKRRPAVPPGPPPKPPQLAFPDTTTIDPYDPRTFGYIELAKVKGAHGVHGWIKVVASSETVTLGPQQRDWFLCANTPSVRYLKPANKRAPRQILLLSGRLASGDDYLLSVDGIVDRDEAEKLRGATLYARQEQQVDDTTNEDRSKEEEFFAVSDLVGLEVFLYESERQAFVGKVGGVVFSEDIADIPGIGHDYLELILPRGVGGTFSLRDELVLIPLVPQLVPTVNINEGIIEIDPPDGLLDLTYVREVKTRIKAFLPSSSPKD